MHRLDQNSRDLLNRFLAGPHGRRTRRDVLDQIDTDLDLPHVVGTSWHQRLVLIRAVVATMADYQFGAEIECHTDSDRPGKPI